MTTDTALAQRKSLRTIIKSFANNLEDLRDFVNLLAPVLKQREDNLLKESAPFLAPLLLSMSVIDPKVFKITESVREKLQKKFGSVEIERHEEPDADGKAKKGGVSFTVKMESQDTAKSFSSALERMQKGQAHTGLLYRSALISLVSAAEWYVSELLHTYYERFPDAAGVSEKSFSLEDLRRLKTIDEATAYLVDSKVENVLRGSFEDWYEFLASKPKLSMSYMEQEMASISEVFQRRNVVIHNGGIVNRIYMAKVAEATRSGLELGQPIQVTREYLDKAISVFERNFILVGAELWKKLEPENDDRASELIAMAFKHLGSERWSIGEALSYFVSKDTRASERSKVIGKINHWQALKWQDRFEEVRSEVKAEDMTAKERIYQLAKHALLDEEEPFTRLLKQMLKSDELPLDDVRTWPLFRKMRSTEAVKEVLSAYAPLPSASAAVDHGQVEPSANIVKMSTSNTKTLRSRKRIMRRKTH